MNTSSNRMNNFVLIFWAVVFGLLFLLLGTTGALAGDAYAQYPGFSDPGSRSSGAPGGGLTAVDSSVDGGAIPTGATAQVVIRFRNEGAQPISTGLIRLYPSSTVSTEVALNQCEEEPLQSGAECAIAISVKGLQSGPWRAEMLMSHSGRSRLVTATLSGSVESSGDSADKLAKDVEALPEKLDFGSLEDSQTLIEPVVLRNVTSTPIDIENIYIDASEQAGYSLKTECDKLAAGQACIAVVTWAPQLRGRSSGVLVVEHTGPAGLSSISLSGEYDPSDVDEAEVFPQAVPGKGLLVSSQTELDFGQGVETASTITVSLVNAGDAALKIDDIMISGSDNGVSFKDTGCAAGTVLEPIQACPLTIKWSPTRVGTLFDDVQVLHDGARGVLVLPIRGEALSTVSQDQKAMVISDGGNVISSSGSGYAPSVPSPDQTPAQAQAAAENQARVTKAAFSPAVANPIGVLDGYKITSFARDRAIINGPGGSRIVFDNDEVLIGGVPWFVLIQKNGIEFLHQGHRVLLLFDRSLSSINRVSASSSSSAASSSGDGG